MSRIAFISDIHANLDALEAVLADIDKQDIKTIICLGDVVGYGAEPEACVRQILDRCLVTVMGNHEAMLSILDSINDWDLGSTVRVPLHLAKEQLNADQFKAVCALPVVADLEPVVAVHSSLHEPVVFHYIDTQETASANFAAQNRWPISFHGHTHVPRIWESRRGRILSYQAADKRVELSSENKYAVNVGSVGQPRDGDSRACYAIYDPAEHALIHRRVAYDIQMARTRIARLKLPANNGLRLIAGR